MESTQFANIASRICRLVSFDIGRVGRGSGLINDDIVANEPVGPIERIDP